MHESYCTEGVPISSTGTQRTKNTQSNYIQIKLTLMGIFQHFVQGHHK